MNALRTSLLLLTLVAPAAAAQQSPGGGPPAPERETVFRSSPSIVGPGVISTPAEEFKAAVAPDQKTLLYVVTERLFRHMTIVESARHGAAWDAPRVAPFSGIWRDGDPSFSPDGKRLLFISNRPMPGDPAGAPRRDFNIWSVARRPDGRWGDPVALERAINTDTAEFAPSLTAAGSLYFSRGDLMYGAEPRGAGFGTPMPLAIKGGDPSISADGRVLIFDADGTVAGDADLFVSCRTADGWTPPSRLADPVSSAQEEGDPTISPDGRTLYFFSRRTPPPDRAPRARQPSYAEIHREAVEEIYNGSRNLFEVALTPAPCGDAGASH